MNPLPQTNLQLYRLMIDHGAAERDLAQMRTAYDLARQLFGAAFRPSHKPFVAHLVGAAGATIRWGERTAVGVAAALHSAYLYGEFGDGERGASPRRRCWLIEMVGAEAESLVFAYTQADDWRRSVEEQMRAVSSNPISRDLTVIKLADLLDELGDGGPAYCPRKSLGFASDDDAAAQGAILAVAEACLPPQAALDFAAEFASLVEFKAPACLVTGDKSFRTASPGVPPLRRSIWGRRFARLRKSRSRGAAA